MTTTQNGNERCSPTCAHPAAYALHDPDGIRPSERACLVHLGTAAARLVIRWHAVTVELA